MADSFLILRENCSIIFAAVKKIIFLHNRAIYYRLPLFKRLAKDLNIEFWFYHEPKRKKLPFRTRYFRFVRIFKIKPISFDLIISFFKEKNYRLVVLSDPERVESMIAFLAAKIKKKKIVLWTESWFWRRENFFDIILFKISKIMLKEADLVIGPGQKTREMFLKLKIAKKKIIIAPNARKIKVKINQKLVKELRKKYNLSNKKVVIYLGRLIKRKGLRYLIKAFKDLTQEIKNVVLLIVGEGKEKQRLERLARNFGLKEVIFSDKCQSKDAQTIISLADVLVLPSVQQRISEPWGLVINESMAVGRPVIATDQVGAAYDLIEKGRTGYMIKERNSRELAKALFKLLSNPKKLKKMGENARKKVEKHYNYDFMAARFKRIRNLLK